MTYVGLGDDGSHMGTVDYDLVTTGLGRALLGFNCATTGTKFWRMAASSSNDGYESRDDGSYIGQRHMLDCATTDRIWA